MKMCIRDRVTIADQESELEICNETWEELRELARCVDSLEEGAGCSIGVRRIRQRLQHVIHRLQNLEAQWGDLEPAHDIKDLIPVSYTHLDVYKRQV